MNFCTIIMNFKLHCLYDDNLYNENESQQCGNVMDQYGFCNEHWKLIYTSSEETVHETSIFCQDNAILVPSLVKIVQLYDDRIKESFKSVIRHFIDGFTKFVSGSNMSTKHQIDFMCGFFEFLATSTYYIDYVKNEQKWAKFHSKVIDRVHHFQLYTRDKEQNTRLDLYLTTFNSLQMYVEKDIEENVEKEIEMI